MKRLAIAMLSLMLLFTVACGGEEPVDDTDAAAEVESVEDVEEPEEEVRSLQGLKDTFAAEGFEVGDNETIAYEMMNADGGMKFELDGELVEIYHYELDNLSEEAAATVEQAKKSGSVDMSGFNIPVKYNDGFILVRHDEHSQGDKIIEVFNTY